MNRMANGTRARKMGSRASPQYQEVTVKRRSAAVNDAGNA